MSGPIDLDIADPAEEAAFHGFPAEAREDFLCHKNGATYQDAQGVPQVSLSRAHVKRTMGATGSEPAVALSFFTGC
jgi:hypothetical protein